MNSTKSSNDNVVRIEAVVLRIPRGRVATYGQIASLAGIPNNARQVGTVLRSLPDDSNVPWHRVVNAQGRISDRGDGAFAGLQLHLLTEEGVAFDDSDRIDLGTVQWRPKR